MKSSPKPAVHKAPKDLRDAIKASKGASTTWKKVTPLGENEWACWVMSAKKEETRKKRVSVAVDKLSKGERRPCCWAGCPHR